MFKRVHPNKDFYTALLITRYKNRNNDVSLLINLYLCGRFSEFKPYSYFLDSRNFCLYFHSTLSAHVFCYYICVADQCVVKAYRYSFADERYGFQKKHNQINTHHCFSICHLGCFIFVSLICYLI